MAGGAKLPKYQDSNNNDDVIIPNVNNENTFDKLGTRSQLRRAQGRSNLPVIINHYPTPRRQSFVENSFHVSDNYLLP